MKGRKLRVFSRDAASMSDFIQMVINCDFKRLHGQYLDFSGFT